jgi:chromate reductase
MQRTAMSAIVLLAARVPAGEPAMSHRRKVAVLVGSLRKESFNRKTARALIAVAPQSLELGIVEIGAPPLYNEDLEKDAAEAWREFRDAIRMLDALLFVTPGYNRSVPGVLKNAIDVGSRPYGKSVFDGKPGAVVSVSPGAIGGFGANHHLRQSMVFLNVPMLQQPEMSIAQAAKLFNEQGQPTSDSTRELAQKFLQAFAQWIERNAPHGARPALRHAVGAN